jgi:hypothetical protein
MADVHILIGGLALCGKPGVPAQWGDGDKWTSWEVRAEATCDECLSAAWKRLAQSDPMMPAEPEPLPVTLDKVFRAHGSELLRALFAWRGQGSITRWKTKISRRLAHLADRLQREYPQATAALQKAGNADAVEDVLSAAARRRTPKGFAAELTRLRDELGSLGQLVDDLADYAHEAAEDEPRAAVAEREDHDD